jgi:hypothetical protein
VIDVLVLYNIVTGIAAGAGLLYLLSEQDFVHQHQRFVIVMLAGLLLYVAVSPVVNAVAPHLTHLIHILAGLLIIWGLYSPLHNDLRTNQWDTLLFRDPRSVRPSDEWMTPMDDEILQVFHSTQLVLSPSIISQNIHRSRDEVNRRLRTLENHGFVSRVERGRYKLTQRGERYLHGGTYEPFVREKENTSDRYRQDT